MQIANLNFKFQIRKHSPQSGTPPQIISKGPSARRQLEEIEDSIEALTSKVSPAEHSLNQVLAGVTNWAVAAAQSLDLMDSFLLYPAARSTQPWKSSFQSFCGSKKTAVDIKAG